MGYKDKQNLISFKEGVDNISIYANWYGKDEFLIDWFDEDSSHPECTVNKKETRRPHIPEWVLYTLLDLMIQEIFRFRKKAGE